MKRTVLISGVASFVMAFAGTIAALTLALPSVVTAQEARIRAEQFTVVGDNGMDRINLMVGPGLASTVQVRDTNGVPRAWINTGSRTGNEADNASFSVLSQDGVTVARLGMGHGPGGTGPLTNSLTLRDFQGQIRLQLRIEEDGTPSIRILDAAGNVTWSAQ